MSISPLSANGFHLFLSIKKGRIAGRDSLVKRAAHIYSDTFNAGELCVTIILPPLTMESCASRAKQIALTVSTAVEHCTFSSLVLNLHNRAWGIVCGS